MSRTIQHKPNYYFHKNRGKPNPMGICRCASCRSGRAGKRNSQIEKLKRKIRHWLSNKQPKKGVYTD